MKRGDLTKADIGKWAIVRYNGNLVNIIKIRTVSDFRVTYEGGGRSSYSRYDVVFITTDEAEAKAKFEIIRAAYRKFREIEKQNWEEYSEAFKKLFPEKSITT